MQPIQPTRWSSRSAPYVCTLYDSQSPPQPLTSISLASVAFHSLHCLQLTLQQGASNHKRPTPSYHPSVPTAKPTAKTQTETQGSANHTAISSAPATSTTSAPPAPPARVPFHLHARILFVATKPSLLHFLSFAAALFFPASLALLIL